MLELGIDKRIEKGIKEGVEKGKKCKEESVIRKQHYIDGDINPMIIFKEEFEKQMTYLKENDFNMLTLLELYSY